MAIGDRRSNEDEARETIYAFNLDEKAGVTPELFAYCLHDYWQAQPHRDKTLPFKLTRVAFVPAEVPAEVASVTYFRPKKKE